MSWDLSRRRLLQLGGATAASVVLTGTGPRALAAGGPGVITPPGKPPVPTETLADLLPQALATSAGQRPRFSWQVPDFGAGTLQRAYQLQLAAAPGGFRG